MTGDATLLAPPMLSTLRPKLSCVIRVHVAHVGAIPPQSVAAVHLFARRWGVIHTILLSDFAWHVD